MFSTNYYPVNNSYESPSTESGSSSSTNNRFVSNQMNFEVRKSSSFSNILYQSGGDELYNMSAEEGIYPNVDYSYPVVAPSYQPEYDYNNEYSTTPLVYSFMPIVPGLYEREGTDNLHKFEDILKKLEPHPLDISAEKYEVIFDQSPNYPEYVNSNKTDSRISIAFNQLEDSSNAVDLSISCSTECNNKVPDLSFYGKIEEMTSSEHKIEEAKCKDDNQQAFDMTIEDEDEKRDDALKEKVQEILVALDVNESSPLKEISCEMKPPISKEEKDLPSATVQSTAKFKSLKESDTFIVGKLKTSLSENCVPPSINTLQLSLSEMLTIYKSNVDNANISKSVIATNSLFVPSHSFSEMLSTEWPAITQVRAPLIAYNRSTDCEDMEVMCNTYSQKFIRAETSSSFNHKTGPTSAKKRIEKQKLLTQSPGSRLSHLAHRRKVLSSASLKNTSVSATYKTFSGGNQMIIDKSKLYHKRKRLSAKKKTPGKRKTPKSAKRQQLAVKPEVVGSSKRALFTSPSLKNANSSLSLTSSEALAKNPRRALFSPQNNAKRKRSPSPDHDAENRLTKFRRRDSPAKLAGSKSFSITTSSTAGSSILDEHFKKTMNYRAQSELTLNQSGANGFGFKRPMTIEEKRKLLWTASNCLSTKQITTDHEKFKDYAAVLCKLIKKLLIEFYNPRKSLSAQMLNYANLMVFYVVQEKPYDEIYRMTRARLQNHNPKKISGYIGLEDFAKNNYIGNVYIRRNSSLLLMTNSNSSLNLSSTNSDLECNFDKNGSDSSLNQTQSEVITNESASKKVLRENSANKIYSVSEHVSTSTPSVLKVRKQISF